MSTQGMGPGSQALLRLQGAVPAGTPWEAAPMGVQSHQVVGQLMGILSSLVLDGPTPRRRTSSSRPWTRRPKMGPPPIDTTWETGGHGPGGGGGGTQGGRKD